MKRQMSTSVRLLIIVLLVGAGLFFWYTKSVPRGDESLKSQQGPIAITASKSAIEMPVTAVPPTPLPLSATVSQDVPFLVQAPGGAWDDPIFQGGCEEASLIMAEAWASERESIDVVAGKQMIRNMSDHAEAVFGKKSYDTSIEDTLKIARDSFPLLRIVSEEEVSLSVIIAHVEAGQLVITPMDGRLLDNPHYTAPGPEYHMLVVTGYDDVTREVITNDPGTRYGAGYRYPEKRFYAAIRDYLTGDHLPVKTIRKNILVISR